MFHNDLHLRQGGDVSGILYHPSITILNLNELLLQSMCWHISITLLFL